MPSLEHACDLDAADDLSEYRDRFLFPAHPSGAAVYLCGNSLGLQPRSTAGWVTRELDHWAKHAVEGHFQGARPWFGYHENFREDAASLVGAVPGEVVVMNALTVNLHLMLVSFYRPTRDRYRIVIEGGAFPSDRYAVASHAKWHGYDPDDAIVELVPRTAEHLLRTEDIEALLAREGESIALVMLGGVNYYTGQAFDMASITAAAHAAGALAGYDLAHAAGNLDLKLHDWGVDFAVWCTYKYLNSGPGGVACAFVHERWENAPELPRMAGWWGNDPASRFSMPDRFVPQPGAAGWQLSNAPVLPMAAFAASLEMFAEVGMARLRRKSEALTAFLLSCLDEIDTDLLEMITPRDPAARGCQLSLRVREGAEALHAELSRRAVYCDFRRPDVVRVAPVPLYNSFEDTWRFAQIVREHTE
jgi:kynureninase